VRIESEPATAQHLQALARANRVRLARAELKRSIARGDVEAADIVRDCPWETESMTLSELLTSQRRWGRTRARKFLLGLALSENKRLGTLTSRQRLVLAESLRERSSYPLEASDDGQDDWAELATVVGRHDELSADLRQLTARRDELIRKLSAAGASRRSVAETASLTVGRVQQILNESKTRPLEATNATVRANQT